MSELLAKHSDSLIVLLEAVTGNFKCLESILLRLDALGKFSHMPVFLTLELGHAFIKLLLLALNQLVHFKELDILLDDKPIDSRVCSLVVVPDFLLILVHQLSEALDDFTTQPDLGVLLPDPLLHLRQLHLRLFRKERLLVGVAIPELV